MKPTVISSRSFNRLDVAALNHDLQLVDWENVFSSTTVGEQWDTFLTNFLPIIDDHAPLKRLTIRNPTAPPLSAATRDLMSQRRAALRRSGRQSSEYRGVNRLVRAEVRRDRRAEIQRDISERGPNKVWQCMRSVVAGKRDGQNVQPELPADDSKFILCICGSSDSCRNSKPKSSYRPKCSSTPVSGREVSNFKRFPSVNSDTRSSACETQAPAVPMEYAFACLRPDFQLSVVSSSTLSIPVSIYRTSPILGSIPQSALFSSPATPPTPLTSDLYL